MPVSVAFPEIDSDSLEYFLKVLNSLNIQAYLCDSDLRVITANSLFLSSPILKSVQSSIIGLNLSEILKEFDERTAELINEVLTKQTQNVSQMRAQDQHYNITYEVVRSPIQLQTASHVRLLVMTTMREIDKQRVTNPLLAHINKEAIHIIDTIDEGIAFIDDKHRLIYVNEVFPKMLGYTRDQMLGEELVKFLSDAEKTMALQRLETRRSREIEESSYNMSMIDSEGKNHLFFITGRDIYNDHGVFIGSIGVFRDLEIIQDVDEQDNINTTLEQLYLDILYKDLSSFGMSFEDDVFSLLEDSKAEGLMFNILEARETLSSAKNLVSDIRRIQKISAFPRSSEEKHLYLVLTNAVESLNEWPEIASKGLKVEIDVPSNISIVTHGMLEEAILQVLRYIALSISTTDTAISISTTRDKSDNPIVEFQSPRLKYVPDTEDPIHLDINKVTSLRRPEHGMSIVMLAALAAQNKWTVEIEHTSDKSSVIRISLPSIVYTESDSGNAIDK